MSNNVYCRTCGDMVTEHGQHHQNCPRKEQAMEELRERVEELEERVRTLEALVVP